MRIPFLFLLLGVITTTKTFSQDTNRVNFNLGQSIVSVRSACFAPCTEGVVFINVHDNEKTSVFVAEDFLKQHGGRLIKIDNNGERFINFRLKSDTFSFDPNRIYTDSGVANTLKLLSAKTDTNAAKEVLSFGKQIVTSFIDNHQLVVALHNNRDSDLSVISYQKDQLVKKHGGDVFVNPEMDPDDFILTTDKAIFDRLKQKNINVVWENVSIAKDDGSLSVYAGIHNIPYINIEAQHDHCDEQFSMIKTLYDIIKEYSKEGESSEM